MAKLSPGPFGMSSIAAGRYLSKWFLMPFKTACWLSCQVSFQAFEISNQPLCQCYSFSVEMPGLLPNIYVELYATCAADWSPQVSWSIISIFNIYYIIVTSSIHYQV